MSFWEPRIDLDLNEGENALFIIRRHWFMLVRNAFLPALLSIGALGLAFFRSIGGTVLVPGVKDSGVLNAVTVGLIIVAIAVAIIWQRTSDAAAKKKKPLSRLFNGLFVLGIVLLFGLAYFSFDGGAIVYVDDVGVLRNDPANIVLYVIGALALLYLGIVVLDWRDDSLILTNERVVLDDEEFIFRHTLQQIRIDDVQQVLMKQDTYLGVLFGYGQLTVQSFSLQRIDMEFASYPQEMQRRISNETNRARKDAEPNLLRRLIQEQIYDQKAQQVIKRNPIRVHERGRWRTGIVGWLFPPNPQIDLKTGTITWRPAWLYVLVAVLRPFLVLVAALLLLAFVLQRGLVPAAFALPIAAIAVLACAARIFWLREELVNDVYILTPREIIDVDKRPFGPVSRRSAPLDRVQNISFDINFVENVFGFGTVKIQTGGTGDFTFNHVPDPRDVQATINDYLSEFKKQAQARALQNSLDILREYHAIQKDVGEVYDSERLTALVREQMKVQGIAPAPDTAGGLGLSRAARVYTHVAARVELLRLLRRVRQRPENTP